MNDNNEKPKNTMEMLFEHTYGKPEQPQQKVITENNGSRPANSYVMAQALHASEKYLVDAGKEINQLPTDVSKRAFEQFEIAQRAINKLQDLVSKL